MHQYHRTRLQYFRLIIAITTILFATALGAKKEKNATPKSEKKNHIQVCHYAENDSDTAELITIDKSSLKEHLAHGDVTNMADCPVRCTPRCDDGNACTLDLCDERKNCLPIEERPPLNCDDNNFCTTDSCDSESGCFSVVNENACDDSIACTNDFCDANSDPNCTNIPDNTACNDDDPCTIDICDTEVGCRYEPNPCDDGNPLTCDQCIPDQGCQNTDLSNGCGSQPINCALNVPTYDEDCNILECNIENAFEGQTCFTLFPTPCRQYTCQSGSCVTTSFLPNGTPCQGLGLTGPCVVSLSTVCTDGACLPEFLPDGTICNTSCEDTNAEVCSAGACIPATDDAMNPIPLCEDTSYDPCNINSAFCADVNGDITCGYLYGTDGCTDGNVCTNDSCDINAGMCQNTPITVEDNCDDGIVCTDDEASCDQFQGIVCTNTFDATNDPGCTQPNAPCLAQGNDCNDNDPCTLDSCNANTGQCSHVPNLSSGLCISCFSNVDCNPTQYQPYLPNCTSSWTGACINNRCLFTATDNLCPWTNRCTVSQPICTMNGCISNQIKVTVLNPVGYCYKNVCDPNTGTISPVRDNNFCPQPNDCCYAPNDNGDGECLSPCSGVGCLLNISRCSGDFL